MKIRPLFQDRRTHLGAVLTTTAAFMLLGSVDPAFAKKGGGGKPGGEDPVEIPFHYQITWHEAEFSTDVIDLRDVASDGTVVGSVKPGGVYGSNIALIRLPNGAEVNLEDLLIQADPIDQVDDSWRVTYAFRICDDLLLGVDVYDETGRLYCGAVKLLPDGTLDWFALFEDLGGDDAFLLDATEGGEFLIATGDFDAHPQGSLSFNPDAIISVWNPATGTTRTLPTPIEGGQTGWFKGSSISDNGTAFLGGSLYGYDFGSDQWSIIDLPEVATTLSPADLSADGTAVAAIAGAPIRRNRTGPPSFARWVPTTNEWETIISASSLNGKAYINGRGEIAGSTSEGVFIFHNDYELQSVNNMIQMSQVSQWDTSADYLIYGISDPSQEEGAHESGVIVGREVGGSYFTLTPVP